MSKSRAGNAINRSCEAGVVARFQLTEASEVAVMGYQNCEEE